jgi:hypothetical protein
MDKELAEASVRDFKEKSSGTFKLRVLAATQRGICASA